MSKGPLVKVAPARFVRKQPDKATVWAYLREVADMAGISPRELWDGFLPLHRETPLPVLISSGTIVVARDSTATNSYTNNLHNGDLYVPFGWAREALRAHRRGIKTVNLVDHNHDRHGRCWERGAWKCVRLQQPKDGNEWQGFRGLNRSGAIVMPSK